MKRILLIMVMMLTFVGAKAQVTMNARVGAGMITDYPGMVGSFQVNIPFKRGGRFTFSPSVEFDGAFCTDEDEYVSKMLLFPLHFGIKAPLGRNALLFPKVGPAFGADFAADDAFTGGISTEIAFEYKHFIVALEAYYGSQTGFGKYFANYGEYEYYINPWKFSISLGYKF